MKNKGENNNSAPERKVKVVNKNGVNYDGKMDRGVMTFTSDVSLPKDDKQLCSVNIINAPQCYSCY